MLCTSLHALLVSFGSNMFLLDVAHYIIQNLQQLPVHALCHCRLKEGAQVDVLPLLEHTKHPALLLLKADSPTYAQV